MDRSDPDDPDGDPDDVGPELWAISSEEADCVHQTEARERLGEDGLDGYYQCENCGAGVVATNEVDFR